MKKHVAAEVWPGPAFSFVSFMGRSGESKPGGSEPSCGAKPYIGELSNGYDQEAAQ